MLLRFQAPGPFVRTSQISPAMPMDAYRRDGELVFVFDIPGIDPATIDLTVEKNALTVSAERHYAKAEGDKVYAAERPQGRFSRQLRLGEHFDADGIEASYEHGVLTVTVPVAEKAKARKITVTTSDASPVEGDAAQAA